MNRQYKTPTCIGACPRIDIFSQIKAFLKNKHSHISDIASIIFFKITPSWGKIAFSGRLPAVILLVLCTISLAAHGNSEAAPPPGNYFTINIPEAALLETIQTLLPLEFTPNHSSFQGKLQIDSINNISINNRTISLSGVISGRDMFIDTLIGGRSFKLKLGHLSMPALCDIQLRFDQSKKQFFITPRLHQTQQSKNREDGGINDPLSMLSDIAGKEYFIDINQFLSLKPMINGQSRSINLEAVDIKTDNNQLIIKLQPVKKNQAQQ